MIYWTVNLIFNDWNHIEKYIAHNFNDWEISQIIYDDQMIKCEWQTGVSLSRSTWSSVMEATILFQFLEGNYAINWITLQFLKCKRPAKHPLPWGQNCNMNNMDISTAKGPLVDVSGEGAI